MFIENNKIKSVYQNQYGKLALMERLFCNILHIIQTKHIIKLRLLEITVMGDRNQIYSSHT